MTGTQKNIIAQFLDRAAASFSGGYGERDVIYDLPDDPETSAVSAAPQNCGQQSASCVQAESEGGHPDSLARIAEEVCACSACVLCEKRTRAVPGEGAARPLVLVVGEGPGADEDVSGRPFVGRAGQLLDKMLSSIGLSRERNCFIANIVKCRPPGNRDPVPGETSACIPFLKRQITLLKPLVILSAGRISSTTLLQTTEGISRIRGIWQRYQGIPLLPTFHPSYLLRDESQKTFAWEDMKSLCRRVAELNGDYERETSELRSARKI